MDMEQTTELDSTCRLDEEAGYMDHMVKETFVLLTQYCSGEKIENKMGKACSMYGGQKRHIRVLVGKPEGKRLLRRPRHKWENNIKTYLQEVGCGGYGLD